MRAIGKLGIICWLIVSWLALFGNRDFAIAAGPGATVTIVGTGTVAVDGIEVSKSPVEVPVGSQVCVVQSVQYVAAGDRWVFTGWDSGRPEELCLTISGAGSYRAVFAREVLVQVRSTLATQRRSMWVRAGVPLKLEVPATVAIGEDMRYGFSEWSEGETPFQPANTIIPLAPATPEVKWVKEYLITVDRPEGVAVWGGGWQAEGADVTLQAAATIEGGNKGERLKFAGWESVGFPPAALAGPQNPLTTLKATGPYTVRPSYQKQYYVVARSPSGTLKKEWVNAGEEVVFEAQAVMEIVPDEERLVFVRWEGMEGLVSPRVSGVVNNPVELRAVYERQVKVTAVGPYGASGGGWYRVGATATISVPGAVQKKFVLRDAFLEFAGYGPKPSVQLVVGEPVTLTALYRSEVDLKVLGILVSLPLGGLLLYFGNRWLLLLVRRRDAARRDGPAAAAAGVAKTPQDRRGEA